MSHFALQNHPSPPKSNTPKLTLTHSPTATYQESAHPPSSNPVFPIRTTSNKTTHFQLRSTPPAKSSPPPLIQRRRRISTIYAKTRAAGHKPLKTPDANKTQPVP